MSYFSGGAPYTITSGMVVLLLVVTVLVLSEAFDNFSLGQLLTLSRTAEDLSEENKQVKRENAQLRTNIVQLQSVVHQSQQSTYVGLNPLYSGHPAPVEFIPVDQVTGDTAGEEEPQPELPLEIVRALESDALNRYLADHLFTITDLKPGARLPPTYEDGMHRLIQRPVTFGWFRHTEQKNQFFDVVYYNQLPENYWDTLYTKLDHLDRLGDATRTWHQLVLVMFSTPEVQDSWQMEVFGLVKHALIMNILVLETMEFSEEGIRRITEQIQQQQEAAATPSQD